MRSARVRPFDEFEDQRPHAVRFLKPVDGGDVRMVQAGKNFGLPLEPCQPIARTLVWVNLN